MANPYKDMHISKYAGFADTSKNPGFAPAFSCESGATLSNEGSFPRQSRARRATFRAEFDLAPPRIPSLAKREKVAGGAGRMRGGATVAYFARGSRASS
jgi:hypothetical protein